MPDSVTDYQPGQDVFVRAYGAWRPGNVNRLGRTRVNVDVVANRAGRVQRGKWVYPCDLKAR